MNLRNPLILALDIDDPKKASEIARLIGPDLGAIKIGPRLLQKAGAEWARGISQYCPTFIDCKYFDIPSTMVSAVKSAYDCGASLVTVHALSGPEALRQLAILETELNQVRPFKILAVSILTSFSESTLPKPLQKVGIDTLVQQLVSQSIDSGISGIVCSPQELSLLEKHKAFKVTPGIRDSSDKADDQARTMSPSQALKAGANALVIGRPILNAPNMSLKIKEILASF